MEQNSICWCPQAIDSWGTPKRNSMPSLVTLTSQELGHCQPILFCSQSHSYCVAQCLSLESPCSLRNVTWVTFLLPPNEEHGPQICTVNTSHTRLTWGGGAAGTCLLHLEKLSSYPSILCIWPRVWQWPSPICTGSRKLWLINGLAARAAGALLAQAFRPSMATQLPFHAKCTCALCPGKKAKGHHLWVVTSCFCLEKGGEDSALRYRHIKMTQS